MASLPTTAHDRRIHELDQNVEQLFDVRKRLGKGAYGIVWKAIDKRQKETVALKKIFDAFRDETDAQRTYREVIFLRAFRHHPNIIRMLDIYKAGNDLDFYLVFEFMESDLHNVIKKGDVLKDIHKRFVMYQLINAIKYMHSGNVIHRDLKPSNILIDTKCRLKVADFGLARTLSSKRRADYEKYDMDNEVMLTDYVATRWYRAPEILVASRKYTKGIDMWSLGCILGEMIRQKPLFQGTSTVNQIEKIVNALPDVTPQDIESMGATFGSALLSKKIVRDRRHSLEEMLRNCCDDAMSLVKSLLILDPDSRMTAKVAIVHPYVNRFRTASADMELRADVIPPLQDDVRYSVNEYRSSLYDMILLESRHSRTSISARPNQSTVGDGGGAPNAGRSVSRIRNDSSTNNLAGSNLRNQSDVNPLGVNTIHRNYTQTWSEQPHQSQSNAQRYHQQANANQQQQQQQQQQQHHHHHHSHHSHHNHHNSHHRRNRQHRQVHVGSPVDPPKISQSGEVTPTPGPAPAPAPAPVPAPIRSANQSLAVARESHVALRRELAAVVATAPRTNNSSLWQAPMNSHSHSHHGSQQTTSQHSVMWQPPSSIMPWPEQTSAQAGMRLRSRSLRKSSKDKAKLKPKLHPLAESQESPKESKPKATLQQHVEHMLAVHNEKKVSKGGKYPNATGNEDHQFEPKEAELETSLKTLQLQQHKKKFGELQKTRQKKEQDHKEEERTEPGPKQNELKKLRVVLTPKVQAKECPSQPHTVAEGGECFYTPMGTQRRKSSNFNNNSSDVTIGTACATANAAAAAAYCYRSRILYLEAEMAKCKRQLVNYVEDNKELLSHRPLRYHYEQLHSEGDVCGCPTPATPVSSLNMQIAKSPQSDSGVEIEQIGRGEHSPSHPNYKNLKMQQNKQKQLQVQEFLTRDDSNAYELRGINNAYRTKGGGYREFSDHQHLQQQHQEQPQMGSLESHQERQHQQSRKDLTYQCQHLATLVPSLKGAMGTTTSTKLSESHHMQQQLDTELRSCQRQRFHHHQQQQQQQQQQHRMRPEDIQEVQFF